MSRWTVGLMVLCGCRFHFGDVAPEDATDALPDSHTVSLACDQPVKLADVVPASNPRLVAALSTALLGTLWITDAGRVAAITVLLDGAEAGTVGGPVEDLVPAITSPPTFVGLAALPDLFCLAVQTAPARSSLITFDTLANVVNGSNVVSAAITHPRGLIASPEISGFAVAGRDPSGETLVTRVDTNAANPSSILVPITAVRHSLLDLNGLPSLVTTSVAKVCRIQAVNLRTGALGAPSTWGTDGQCDEPFAARVAGRNEILTLRHDTVDNDVNHAVAMVNGQMFTIPGEGRLATPASEVRAVATDLGYWTAFDAAGMLMTERVDLGGAISPAKPVAPIATDMSYDLVERAGAVYLVWYTSGGVWAEQMCP